MPIRGMTDEDGLLPSLGWIKMGVKVPTKTPGVTAPRATEYFVCPPEVLAVYGKEPQELGVVLRGKTDEDVFPHYLKHKGPNGGLICKGDGVTASRVNKMGEWEEGIPCDPEKCPRAVAGDCKPDGILRFTMPSVAGLGVWLLDVGRKRSIKNIQRGLEMLRSAAGRIDDIPMRLKIRMEMVSYPKDGKMQHKKGAILYLFPKQSQDELMAMRDAQPDDSAEIAGDEGGGNPWEGCEEAIEKLRESIYEAAGKVGYRQVCDLLNVRCGSLNDRDVPAVLMAWLRDKARTEAELEDVLIAVQQEGERQKAAE